MVKVPADNSGKTAPFEASLDVPNRETKAALLEIQDMRAHPEKYKRYSSFSEALRDVLFDA